MMYFGRVLEGSGFRSRKAKIIMATVAIVSCSLLGGFPGAGARAFAQSSMTSSQDPFQSNQQTLHQNRFPQIPSVHSRGRSEKQKQALLDHNFKQMKKHAKRLADLATSLQKEIAESNEDVLSLEIVKKAEQVEKLAKKIKNEAKGN